LHKSPNPANLCNSQSVAVAYTHVVTNSGDFFEASGTLVDDAGTPGNQGDDFGVGTWGPLAPGASQTLTATRTLNIAAPLTNTATASGTSGTGTVSKTATATVTPHLCQIDLAKAAFPPDICAGSPTQVTYGYSVINSGDFFTASGTLVDDTGTPTNLSDDFTVGSWGPLTPGQSQTLTKVRTLNISAPLTNTATASGTEGTAPVTKTATATVNPHRCTIDL